MLAEPFYFACLRDHNDKVVSLYCQSYYEAESVAKQLGGKIFKSNALGYWGAEYDCRQQFLSLENKNACNS